MKKLSKIFAVVLCLAMALSMLTMGAAAATEKSVEFTVDSLGLESQAYTASTATVDGVAVEWIQLGNYGDGIQMRDKDGKTSSFWNTAAIDGKITKIEFTYSDSKNTYDNNNMIVNFGNSAKGADCAKTLVTSKDTKSYTITPDGDYSFFYIEWDTGYSSYWKSIKVYYEDAAGSTATEGTAATEGTGDSDKTADTTAIVPMVAVLTLGVTGLVALVIGNKKRMF